MFDDYVEITNDNIWLDLDDPAQYDYTIQPNPLYYFTCSNFIIKEEIGRATKVTWKNKTFLVPTSLIKYSDDNIYIHTKFLKTKLEELI